MTFAFDQFTRPTRSNEYLHGRLVDETPHVDDKFFDGSAGGTELTVSGTATWQEARGVKSVVFDDQTLEDHAANLWTITSASSPMTLETALTLSGEDIANLMGGLVFSDGTAAGSNKVGNTTYMNATQRRHTLSEGTFTAHSTAAGDHIMGPTAGYGLHYLQLIWVSANTWKSRWSIDGVTWRDQFGTFSDTMTPTTFGIWVSTWGGTDPGVATFHYVRVYDSDLSV